MYMSGKGTGGVPLCVQLPPEQVAARSPTLRHFEKLVYDLTKLRSLYISHLCLALAPRVTQQFAYVCISTCIRRAYITANPAVRS